VLFAPTFIARKTAIRIIKKVMGAIIPD